MTKFRKIICTILAMTLLIGLVAEPAQAKPKANCKSLCSAALKTTGGSANLKYASKSALDFGARRSSRPARRWDGGLAEVATFPISCCTPLANCFPGAANPRNYEGYKEAVRWTEQRRAPPP